MTLGQGMVCVVFLVLTTGKLVTSAECDLGMGKLIDYCCDRQ